MTFGDQGRRDAEDAPGGYRVERGEVLVEQERSRSTERRHDQRQALALPADRSPIGS